MQSIARDVPGLEAPVGQWGFVCYGDDGAGTLTFYSNGQVGTTAGSEYAYTIGTLYLGSTSIGGTTTQSSLLGAMDEITVWGRALDAADLAALWNSGVGCKVR